MTTVRLYLMTDKVIVRMERDIEFMRVPCVGEWLRFESSGLFPHMVTEVTHAEDGSVVVVIGAQREKNGKYCQHESVEDLQGDVNDLTEAGWSKMSEAPNKVYKNDV